MAEFSQYTGFLLNEGEIIQDIKASDFVTYLNNTNSELTESNDIPLSTKFNAVTIPVDILLSPLQEECISRLIKTTITYDYYLIIF